MVNFPQKRLPLIVLTACLALAAVFAEAFVIEEQNHEHVDAAGRSVPAGEDCHICLEIQIAIRLIEAFGRLGVSIAVTGFIVYALPLKPQRNFYLFTPFALKVKFNC
jgi:hypothetical protein